MKQQIDIEREAESITFDLEDDTVMSYCAIVKFNITLQQIGLKQSIYFQKLMKGRFEFLFITAEKKKINKQNQENFVVHLS